MSYRIEIQRGAQETVIVFTGILDEAALDHLAVHLAGAAPTRLVLAVGTEVTPTAMDRLRELPTAVHAESSYLMAWLRSSANRNGEPSSPKEES